MTTEGHVLWLDQNYLRPISSVRRKLRGAEQHQCPAYELPLVAYDNAQGETGLTAGIRARADTEYIRQLIGVRPSDLDTKRSFPSGWCEIPRVNLFVSGMPSLVLVILMCHPVIRLHSVSRRAIRTRGLRS